MAGSRSDQDTWVDAELRRLDPVHPELTGGALRAALELAGHQILQHASNQRAHRRRVLRAPRRLALIGLVVLCASGAAAAATGLFVNANTHTYNHGWQHIAGGPGENITGAGTNFVQVVRAESAGAGIVFPSTYASWRTHEIKQTRRFLCLQGHRFSKDSPRCAQESTGMLNVNLAQDAFVTWVLDWRHAKLTGDAAQARQAARVISDVLRWKAVTDIEYIHGMFTQSFAWMRPYMQAVAANDLGKVNKMIGSQGVSNRNQGGSYFVSNDPGFYPWFLQRLKGASRSRQQALEREMNSIYLRYLDRHGS